MKITFIEKIKAIPVLRPFIAYVLGWVVGYVYPKVSGIMNLDLIHFILIISFFSFLFRKYFFDRSQAILVLLAFFLIGTYSSVKEESPKRSSDMEMLYMTELADPPLEKEKTTLLKLKLLYCFTDSTFFNETVYVNAYFEKTKEELVWPEIGDRCVVNMRVLELKNSGNPFEFDYAAWLKRKDVFFTAFVKTDHWYSTGLKNKKFLYSCKIFREWLKDKILDYRKDEFLDEKSVLLAITLGSKEFLDSGIKSDFANAGAIHVMAVSGLHVGLIWMFIGFLTNFLKSAFIGRMLQFILILTILWGYAFVTGLSPSVTRSCLMFSLVSFGSLIMRDSSVYNTVLISAFLQLLFKPDLILDTGFQFSYTAVFSILFFQPLLKKLFHSESIIINWFLDLISVSIAAQILTFPLAIYYFHQFPLYFILSNIIIIPLVTILMMAFICSMCFIMFPFIFNIAVSILISLSHIMIVSVNYISGLPYSTAEHLSISALQMSLLLLSPLLLLVFIHHRKLLFFKFSLLALSLFFYLGIYRYSERITNRILIFNVPNTLAIDVLVGDNHYLIHNIAQENALQDLEYYAKDYWIRSYSYPPVFIPVDSIANYQTELCIQVLQGKSNFILALGEENIVFIGDFKGISIYEGDFLTNNEVLFIFDPYFSPKYDNQMIFKPERIVIAPSCRLYSNGIYSLSEKYYLIREHGSLSIDIK